MPARSVALMAAGLMVAGLVAAATPALADPPRSGGDRPSTFAVIGDVPYGDAQLAAFPGMIARIDADPDVSLVAHLGDIKSGSTACTDAYLRRIRTDVDGFTDPFVYTPGDNEWTDCHRPNNGGYNPLERLAAVRRIFFDHPGRTLGQHPVPVVDDGAAGLPENVRFERSRVEFAALHAVGSNNGLLPWTGRTTVTHEQAAEERHRTDDTLRLIRATFAAAHERHARAVVLLMQADMFDPTVGTPTAANFGAFTPVVREIARESAGFRGPVYLFNGDSHRYHVDRPLAAGSSWLAFYRSSPAANLTRVTVDGSDAATKDWLKVTIDPAAPAVLSWRQVPYTS